MAQVKLATFQANQILKISVTCTIFCVAYAVSKEALRLFIQEALPDPEKCHTEIRPLYKGDEDTEFGMCLQSVGVLPGNAMDANGSDLFSNENPFEFLREVKDDYKKWQEFDSWFSEHSITFHYLQPEEMYACEVLSNYFKPTETDG